MQRQHCEPAHSLIEALGGLSRVAGDLGVAMSTVQRWRWAGPDGCDGYIPRKYHAQMMVMAADRGIDLSPAAFVDPAIVRHELAASSPREAAG